MLKFWIKTQSTIVFESLWEKKMLSSCGGRNAGSRIADRIQMVEYVYSGQSSGRDL